MKRIGLQHPPELQGTVAEVNQETLKEDNEQATGTGSLVQQVCAPNWLKLRLSQTVYIYSVLSLLQLHLM